MAKKKDTLKDLNEFMKNQPNKADAGNEDYLSKEPTTLAEVEKLKSEVKRMRQLPEGALHENDIVNFISAISKSHQISSRHILYNVCERVLSEQEEQEPADIMLQNLLVYLKHQDLLVHKIKS